MNSIEEAVHRAAHLLPAQGPISVFIHHNTLHAFEHLPFEEAVVEAGRVFGCEPFLSRERFRKELAVGRIRGADLDAVLEEELGQSGEECVSGLATRKALRRVMLDHVIERERGAALAWLIAETGAVAKERDLWEAAVRAARTALPAADRSTEPVRHRDLLLEMTGIDSDARVHPRLIRLASAFLDQGIAYWPLPGRENGFFRAAGELGVVPGDTANAEESVLHSLRALGVGEEEWDAFLPATLLALRGFAGMMWQIETRPDRVPVHAPRARLMDFLAVRLVLERDALEELSAKALGYRGLLSDLRAFLRERRRPPAPAPTAEERAYPLFQIARILGWTPEALSSLSADSAGALLGEIESFSGIEQRRLLHLAYERRHRMEVLDALAAPLTEEEASVPPIEPLCQAVFCIDEREESMRRHLEEVEPRARTESTAGFFGIAMYYRGVGDAHSRALCPIVLRPQHEVEERVQDEPVETHRRKRAVRRALGRLLHATRVGSRTFTRGTLLTALLGIGSAVPLAFRVLFPRLTARMRRRVGAILEPPATRLALERDESRAPSLGTWSGFTLEEMAEIVGRGLEDLGLESGLAPLVILVGHGSSSLNNPHESAHDCGACGGGRGGPNARAFARMANDPRVRAILARRGIAIEETTWFVGAYHNTCDDSVTWFDRDEVPPPLRGRFSVVERAFDRARARNAHERCRRFESLPRDLSPAAALAHVEERSEDLAQTRPEYGHATNAVCVIGRRSRTRGLFLDRRAFLVSYHPELDDDQGTILGRTLAAAIPVAAGINLEYYFSYVDPTGYGCGTKLPHNVTALLGVMDGHASDLRTGLPWQMVEIHEPVRLLVVIETALPILECVLARSEGIAALIRNRWIQLATLDPRSTAIDVAGRAGFTRYAPERSALPRVAASGDWYAGRMEHLPPARIGRPAARLSR